MRAVASPDYGFPIRRVRTETRRRVILTPCRCVVETSGKAGTPAAKPSSRHSQASDVRNSLSYGLPFLLSLRAGNAYDEDTTLRALERYGTSFHIGMTTLVVFGVLTADFAASSAAAAVEDRAPTELWEQFPLDGVRGADTPAEQSADSGQAVSESASESASVQAAQSVEADETVRFAIVAAGGALLIVGIGAAFARTRRRRRRRAGPSEQMGPRKRRLRAPADPPATARHEVERRSS